MDEISEELARIHAHLCGDGCISIYRTAERDRVWRAEIVYTNTNPDLINEFRADMKKVFNVRMSLKPKYNVVVKSKRIVRELLQLGEYSSRKWTIPEQIKEATNKIKLEWLYAFFKDEAYCERRYNRIRIKSMNKNGLSDTKELLDSMSVFSKITGPNIDTSWYLTIPRVSQTILKNFKKKPTRSKKEKIAGGGFSWGQKSLNPF